jgi:APA family basic amino acid/polyamine antiporter
VVGFLIYFGYSRRRSHLGQGHIEVHEAELDDIPPHIPGIDAPKD